jgi:hypothetical protein
MIQSHLTDEHGTTVESPLFRGFAFALLCAIVPALCYLLMHPYVEIGLDDEWSYVKSAQVLAQTGHIAYNGWAAPMLGWQLYLGAAFVKLFGFSFTAVRLSILPIAMLTSFLLQRLFVRMGIEDRNAAIATLIFVLSPLFLPLTVTFMSDVCGVFSIVLCLYMCVRAVQANSDFAAGAWVSFAALSNAVAGTVRQNVWLGVLVMVPSALWLLRRRPRVVLIGGLSCIAGVGFIIEAVHWLYQQPFSWPERLFPESFGLRSLINLSRASLSGGLQLVFLLLPIAASFIASLRPLNRRKVAVLGGSWGGLLLLFAFLSHWGGLQRWLAPFLGNYMTENTFPGQAGLLDSVSGPSGFNTALRLFLTATTCTALVSVLIFLAGIMRSESALEDRKKAEMLRAISVIVGPFVVAYICLLLPRSSEGGMADRYLLPLMIVILPFLTLLYQERVSRRLPVVCVLALALFAGFGIAATHDQFSLYRGYAGALKELDSAGVPRTAIVGPWELNGWTELEVKGYVNNELIRNPKGVYRVPPDQKLPPSCSAAFLEYTIDIHPLFGLSLDPNACGGMAKFAPATYYTWLPPHIAKVYIVKYPATATK